MYCSNCGAQGNGGKFCASCGYALIQSPQTPEPVAQHAPTAPQGSYAPPVQFPPPAPTAVMNQAFSSQQLEPYQAPKVTFGEAIKLGFMGYVVWNARSTRAEYWWWTLFIALVYIGCLAIDAVATFGVLTFIFCLVIFLPTLSVTIRRFHDTNRSGGWFWIGLIPIVGGIIQLVFFCTESSRYATRWNRSLVTDLRNK
jgi:uncharacterized membrane protein YhaH (DUF805 family)